MASGSHQKHLEVEVLSPAHHEVRLARGELARPGLPGGTPVLPAVAQGDACARAGGGGGSCVGVRGWEEGTAGACCLESVVPPT